MPDFLVTWNFKGGGEGGWSENVFVTRDDILIARTYASQVGELRLALLAQGYRLEDAVVSDVAILRDSKQVKWVGPAAEGRFPVSTTRPAGFNERPFERLLVRMEAGALYRRPYEMGGLPASIVTQDGIYTPPRAWETRFEDWRVGFRSDGTAKLRTQRRNATYNPSAITVGDAVDRRRMVLVFPNLIAGPPALDDKWRISRFRPSANVNGVWQVLTYQAGVPQAGMSTITFKQKRYVPLISSVATNIGVAGPIGVVDIFKGITDIIPQRGVSRKTGRPFDVLHGRLAQTLP